MNKIVLGDVKPQKKENAKPGKLMMADWARKELRRREWSEWRAEFAKQVRLVFVLLLLATAVVFGTDERVKIKTMAFEMAHHAIDAAPPSKALDRYRQSAKKYEKQLDDVSK